MDLAIAHSISQKTEDRQKRRRQKSNTDSRWQSLLVHHHWNRRNQLAGGIYISIYNPKFKILCLAISASQKRQLGKTSN